MSHTKGPWTYNLTTGVVRSVSDDFPSCRQPVICDLRRWPHEDTTYIDPANARLIAAAPDLLAVVQDLVESADYWCEYDVPVGIVHRMKAAIAKAVQP